MDHVKMRREREQVIGIVRSQVSAKEEAIKEHRSDVSAVYFSNRDPMLGHFQLWQLLMDAQQEAIFRVDEGKKWPDAIFETNLYAMRDPNDIRIALTFVLCSSFMAAWLDLNGDTAIRDKARESCSVILAGLKFPGEAVVIQHKACEDLWRDMLRTSQNKGCGKSTAQVLSAFVAYLSTF